LILIFTQVNSYNPRTSHGDHQFFIYIKAQDAETVYLPVVPTKLGDISINIEATTLIASDRVTRNVHVEVCFLFNILFMYVTKFMLSFI
jgi:hypothetical protein